MVKKGKKKGKILGLKFKEEDEGVLFCYIWLMKKEKILRLKLRLNEEDERGKFCF